MPTVWPGQAIIIRQSFYSTFRHFLPVGRQAPEHDSTNGYHSFPDGFRPIRRRDRRRRRRPRHHRRRQRNATVVAGWQGN